MAPALAIIVTARDEAARLSATLGALAAAFPGARTLVADDGSRDPTAAVARAGGAAVVAAPRRLGKGGAATLAARVALAGSPTVVLLCDADLGESASRLAPLVATVEAGDADLAIAAFAQRVGGGLGLALGAGRRAVRGRCGARVRAPLSGQRAVRGAALARLLPFAPRFGMEVGMTIDAVRAGLCVRELELDLAHRVTGRSPQDAVHRARQLADVLAASWARRASQPTRGSVSG